MKVGRHGALPGKGFNGLETLTKPASAAPAEADVSYKPMSVARRNGIGG